MKYGQIQEKSRREGAFGECSRMDGLFSSFQRFYYIRRDY